MTSRANLLGDMLVAANLFIAAILFTSSTYASTERTEENKNKCEATDIVFAIDTTYSLSATIYDIKRELDELLQLALHVSDGKLRLGLVTFKDNITIEEDLNASPTLETKIERIYETIYDIQTKGGGGGPEASDEALNTIINNLSSQGRNQSNDFNGIFQGDTKIIILITDNLPGGFDDRFQEGIDDAHAASQALAASEQDIVISSIYTPTSYFERNLVAENIMRDYALITGGLYIRIEASGKGAAKAIADIINACGKKPLV